MCSFFITSISIHLTFRFNHHAMKIYKLYYIVGRKNTNHFFISSLVFSAKQFTSVLLETASILNNFFITSDTCIVIIITYCFFTIKHFLFSLPWKFLFGSLPSKNLFFNKNFTNHILHPCLSRSLWHQIEDF